jgi:hypothetical protein
MRIRKTRENIIEMFFFDRMEKQVYKIPDFYNTCNDKAYKNLIDNISIEKQARFIEVFYKFCELTNYKCNNIKKIYFNRAENFINDLYESKMLMAYNKIDKIDSEIAEIIETKSIWCSNATQEEKFIIKRYYFDSKFSYASDNDRKFIWDNRLESYFDNIDNELITKINKDNDIDNLYNLNLNNIKISDETNKYIDEHFKSNIKNNNQKISKILNNLLGCELIETVKVSKKSKATKYVFSEISTQLNEIKKKRDEVEYLF